MAQPQAGGRLVVLLATRLDGPAVPLKLEVLRRSPGERANVPVGRIEDGDGHRAGMDPALPLRPWNPLNADAATLGFEPVGAVALDENGDGLVAGARVRLRLRAVPSAETGSHGQIGDGEFRREQPRVVAALGSPDFDDPIEFTHSRDPFPYACYSWWRTTANAVQQEDVKGKRG